MQRVKKFIGGTLATIAIVIFCIEGGIEILPLQVVGVMALSFGMAILMREEKENGRR